ncbi:MAG TPA: TfuA-like protein, partial [Geminicoccaceae bacterium]|nr:TfuA-like protein [Geminicoccaceae bacterium]
MKACVFVGPTLRPGDLGATADLAVLPPVAQGDVYRVGQSRPRAIGIIDGYFEGVLSVWHKEILWAMAEGIHVFGSASMGALRAVELHAFGMQGIGRIFEAYRAGELEDDDEVAVIHGPAETGYLALSEAMVNIRGTLAEAERAGVIRARSREALVRIAKDLFYHDRTFEHLLDRAAGSLVDPEEIAALRAWLPTGRIDQKREDALAMLAAMQALLASDPEPLRVDYAFEWTEVWDSATAASAVSPGTAAGGPRAWLPDDRVLEELRLEADTYLAVRDQALLRFLAAREAGRRRQTVDPTAAREIFAG